MGVLDRERDPFGVFIKWVPGWATSRFGLVAQAYRFLKLVE